MTRDLREQNRNDYLGDHSQFSIPMLIDMIIRNFPFVRINTLKHSRADVKISDLCSMRDLSYLIFLYPDLKPSQYQYWARQIASLISVLTQSYDHVTFYNCQYKCKSWPRRASLNASLGQDLARLKNVKNSRKKRQKWPKNVQNRSQNRQK